MAQNVANPQYETYHVFRRRTRVTGAYQMPTAAPTPSASQIVVLNAAMEQETIAYIAVRKGAPPKVPAVATTNTNRVLLAAEQVVNFAIEDIDGSMVYYLGGWMKYAVVASEGMAADFNTGKTPWQTTADYVPGSTFDPNLLNWQTVQPEAGQVYKTLPTILRAI